MREIWHDMADWPFHQISSKGRVRALPGARIKKRVATKIEIRKICFTAAGYPVIAHGNTLHYVHDLVLTAFFRPRHGKEQCRHLNGNPTDNRSENLRWGTHSQNEADKILHGRSNHGERNGQSILTRNQVNLIRKARGPRGVVTLLAKQFGVSHTTISMIRSGQRWREKCQFQLKR